jgi:hypothetical protein
MISDEAILGEAPACGVNDRRQSVGRLLDPRSSWASGNDPDSASRSLADRSPRHFTQFIAHVAERISAAASPQMFDA